MPLGCALSASVPAEASPDRPTADIGSREDRQLRQLDQHRRERRGGHQPDGEVVDDLDRGRHPAGCGRRLLGGRAGRQLDRGFDIGGGEWLAVVEGDALAEHELPGRVVDLRPAFGQTRGECGNVRRFQHDQRVEDLPPNPPLALRGREVLMPVGPERFGDQEAHLALGLLASQCWFCLTTRSRRRRGRQHRGPDTEKRRRLGELPTGDRCRCAVSRTERRKSRAGSSLPPEYA